MPSIHRAGGVLNRNPVPHLNPSELTVRMLFPGGPRVSGVPARHCLREMPTMSWKQKEGIKCDEAFIRRKPFFIPGGCKGHKLLTLVNVSF